MDPKHAAVRRTLVAARDELAKRLHKVRVDEMAQPLSADSADRAQEQENDEVLDRIDLATEALLKQYRQAIERIDAGLYGICETCGFSVEARRLQSMPEVTECTECARAARARAA
jgi:DnaK suppressor protein